MLPGTKHHLQQHEPFMTVTYSLKITFCYEDGSSVLNSPTKGPTQFTSLILVSVSFCPLHFENAKIKATQLNWAEIMIIVDLCLVGLPGEKHWVDQFCLAEFFMLQIKMRPGNTNLWYGLKLLVSNEWSNKLLWKSATEPLMLATFNSWDTAWGYVHLLGAMPWTGATHICHLLQFLTSASLWLQLHPL